MYKKYLSSWVILFGSLITVALGMPPGKDNVPGPMVEDGPAAQVPVEDADQQKSRSMAGLEARSKIFTTTNYNFHLQS